MQFVEYKKCINSIAFIQKHTKNTKLLEIIVFNLEVSKAALSLSLLKVNNDKKHMGQSRQKKDGSTNSTINKWIIGQ